MTSVPSAFVMRVLKCARNDIGPISSHLSTMFEGLLEVSLRLIETSGLDRFSLNASYVHALRKLGLRELKSLS